MRLVIHNNSLLSTATVNEVLEAFEALGFQVNLTHTPEEAMGDLEANGVPRARITTWDEKDPMTPQMYEMGVVQVIVGEDDAETAVLALQFADDYVRVQYAAPAELAVRTRRALSRAANFNHESGPEVVVSDRLSVDHIHRSVTVNGETRKLTPTENALLSVLLAHRGQIVDADTLIERVWRLDPSIKDRNALRVHIHRLRNKIEEDPDDPQNILTERGIGYSFKEDSEA